MAADDIFILGIKMTKFGKHPDKDTVDLAAEAAQAALADGGVTMKDMGILAAGNLIPEPVAAADWLRIAELVATYRDLPLGTVDASVVATAERLNVREIATLDRRHFTVVRPAMGDLQLVP